MRTISIYHATLKENIPSILQHGIVPRGGSFCEHLVEKHGAATHPSDLKLAIKRCQRTQGRVFTSGHRPYAVENCRASLEAEADLLRSKLRESYKRAHNIPPDIAPDLRTCWTIREQIEQELKEKHPCSIVTLHVPCDTVPFEYNGKQTEMPLCTYLETLSLNLREKWPETTDEEVLELLGEITFTHIPKEWIHSVEDLKE